MPEPTPTKKEPAARAMKAGSFVQVMRRTTRTTARSVTRSSGPVSMG
jgi:hypothetical protein